MQEGPYALHPRLTEQNRGQVNDKRIININSHIGGSMILVRGWDQGVTARKALSQGVAGGLQPLPGSRDSPWWGLGRSPRKFPKFAKFFIDF